MRTLQRFIGGFGLWLQAVAIVVVSGVLVTTGHANRLLALLPLSGVLVGAIIGAGLRNARAPFVRQHRKQLELLISCACMVMGVVIFVLTFVRHHLSPLVGGAAGVAVAVVVLGLAASGAGKTE